MFKVDKPIGKSSKAKREIKYIGFDIIDSWNKGLRYCGEDELLNRVSGKSKIERMKIVREWNKEHNPHLMKWMEDFWMKCINNFIKINGITEREYVAHFYDAIYLNVDRDFNDTITLKHYNGPITFRKEYEEAPIDKIVEHMIKGNVG